MCFDVLWDCLYEQRAVDGFDDVVVTSGVETLLAISTHGGCREGDDRPGPAHVSKLRGGLVSVEDGHLHVHENAVQSLVVFRARPNILHSQRANPVQDPLSGAFRQDFLKTSSICSRRTNAASQLDLRFGHADFPSFDQLLNCLEEVHLWWVAADVLLPRADECVERNDGVLVRLQILVFSCDEKTALASLHVDDQLCEMARIGDDRRVMFDTKAG